MAMFIGYFEVSVNFNIGNRRKKFMIAGSRQYDSWIQLPQYFLEIFIFSFFMQTLNFQSERKENCFDWHYKQDFEKHSGSSIQQIYERNRPF